VDHRTDGVLKPDELSAVLPTGERLTRGPVAVVECVENIPCNPCVAACPKGAITIEGDINGTPSIDFDRCDGCGICIAACPGLAIFVVDMSGEGDTATVMLPYEFVPLPSVGETVAALDRAGTEVCEARVTKVLNARSLDRTPIVSLEVPRDVAMTIRHFRRGGS